MSWANGVCSMVRLVARGMVRLFAFRAGVIVVLVSSWFAMLVLFIFIGVMFE